MQFKCYIPKIVFHVKKVDIVTELLSIFSVNITDIARYLQDVREMILFLIPELVTCLKVRS